MPRIPAHTLDSAPDGSKEIASHLKQRMGKFLNIMPSWPTHRL